ncbi:MAG: hypothetical protein RLZZ308_81 [Candidatus Parcubacteria bacterium]|jgi:undecaprenyl diphosphate synthase
MNGSVIPQHIAIIPDGNRRWAKKKGLPVLSGHLAGYERVHELTKEARAVGVKYVTIWAFSTENWNRNEEEVDDLLTLIYKGLKELQGGVLEEKSRFVHLGRKDRLNKKICNLIEEMEESTKQYTDFCICIAIDYGGDDEVRRALLLYEASHDIVKTFVDFLDTSRAGIPSPDLIIRTSGEIRTSGFMPLQSLYSEWYFDIRPFPEFGKDALHEALHEYSTRNRRFGK